MTALFETLVLVKLKMKTYKRLHMLLCCQIRFVILVLYAAFITEARWTNQIHPGLDLSSWGKMWLSYVGG